MSKYSGKFDLCDLFCEKLDKIKDYKIYLGKNIAPLDIKTEFDIIPYYSYTMWLCSYDSNNGGTIRICNESFVDYDEKDTLNWYKQECERYINKCKRNKKEPNIKEFIAFIGEYNEQIKAQIFDKVIKKESLNDIHLPMHEYYRELLCKEMIRAGYDVNKSLLWCFGYRKEYPKFNCVREIKDGKGNLLKKQYVEV